MNVIVTAGVVWVLLQNRGPCESSTRILNWQTVLPALPFSFCITSFVSLLSVQLACINAYGNVGGYHLHCWVSLVCLSLIVLISSLTVFILHMRLCSVACVFWTSLAMAFKALCLKWCNLQWCHGQSSCVHSVRRGLSYYNAQCFINYSLHGGNCSLRHTVAGFFWLLWKKCCL